jgi:hypothetical protein
MNERRDIFETEKAIAERIFEEKEGQRKKRAALPIEEKLKILVEMQKRALAIAESQGRDTSGYYIWKL